MCGDVAHKDSTLNVTDRCVEMLSLIVIFEDFVAVHGPRLRAGLIAGRHAKQGEAGAAQINH